jgi:hypothetical protein
MVEVRDTKQARIIEYRTSKIERYPVLLQIACCFCLVPLETKLKFFQGLLSRIEGRVPITPGNRHALRRDLPVAAHSGDRHR